MTSITALPEIPAPAPLTSPVPGSELWERWQREPNTWFTRFNGYLQLKAPRTVTEVFRRSGQRPASLENWLREARHWCWQERAEAWDQHCITLQLARKEEILTSGLALDYERVDVLKSLGSVEQEVVQTLASLLKQDPTSQKAARIAARYVQLKRSLDETLKALAEETGGRIKRVNVTRDLQDYAIALAREQGYDESVAISIAKMVALDSPR